MIIYSSRKWNNTKSRVMKVKEILIKVCVCVCALLRVCVTSNNLYKWYNSWSESYPNIMIHGPLENWNSQENKSMIFKTMD